MPITPASVTELTAESPSALSAVATLVARPFTNLDEVMVLRFN